MVDSVTLHDRDFYAWTLQQAALLREGRLSEADIDYTLANSNFNFLEGLEIESE